MARKATEAELYAVIRGDMGTEAGEGPYAGKTSTEQAAVFNTDEPGGTSEVETSTIPMSRFMGVVTASEQMGLSDTFKEFWRDVVARGDPVDYGELRTELAQMFGAGSASIASWDGEISRPITRFEFLCDSHGGPNTPGDSSDPYEHPSGEVKDQHVRQAWKVAP